MLITKSSFLHVTQCNHQEHNLRVHNLVAFSSRQKIQLQKPVAGSPAATLHSTTLSFFLNLVQ